MLNNFFICDYTGMARQTKEEKMKVLFNKE